MELERIVNLMVKNKGTLNKKDALDMKMFPEDSIKPIFSAAAEKALEQEDLDSASSFLYQGKIWDKMLKLGKKYFSRINKKDREIGKNFLVTLMHHDKLPKNLSIELGNDILRNEEHSRYMAAMAFKAGNALKRAEEVAYELLGEGDFEDGLRFLSITGKDLSNAELQKYANIALENERYEDCLSFHQLVTLDMPIDTAKKVIKGDWGLFDDVIKYMDEMDESFSRQEFAEFGHIFFNNKNYDKSLEIYRRAGNAVTKDEYKVLGEAILSHSERLIEFGSAYDFLSMHNKKDAKKRLLDIANDLQSYKDIREFEKIYGILKMKFPMDLAKKAAKLSEAEGKYDEAAKFYKIIGKNEKVREIGNKFLESDNSFDVRYKAENCFEMIKDKEGLAITKFYAKNIKRYG